MALSWPSLKAQVVAAQAVVTQAESGFGRAELDAKRQQTLFQAELRGTRARSWTLPGGA